MTATTRRRIATVAPRTGCKPARGVPATPGLVVTAPDGAPISHQASRWSDDARRDQRGRRLAVLPGPCPGDPKPEGSLRPACADGCRGHLGASRRLALG